ncbi:TetR family transcriptional regulator [Vallitalea pronyensis]|uniref:TetR family transcriptional regulator n=1 Tax=Vallitalea pronyensis TaxID=1348613 RepID=A0A8J8MKM8_9FIRM|nr:TetR/AcrR family transcriptional regulator [Vallitalea pronyensis]QUI23415.1 TetR family transcriptional regulator [Vallitalea pronyensis]
MDIKANVKDQILNAVIELIDEVDLIERITSRKIAEKAGVNLALINYYYQSKDNLINQAVSYKMELITRQMSNAYSDVDSPYQQLIGLLLSSADLSFKYNKFFKVAVETEMRNGYRNSLDLVMPLLKEIFNNTDKEELRIIAMQLMIPFHQIIMYPDLYSKYLETDFFDKSKRDDTIIKMMQKALGKKENETVGRTK